jgi:hypothetical protein
MRGVLGVVHPGMRYLLDMVLAEEAARDARPDPGARRFDRVGPTPLTAVIEAWAAA